MRARRERFAAAPNLLSSVRDRLPDFVDRDQLQVRAFTTGRLV
jgi:hypothetical protein